MTDTHKIERPLLFSGGDRNRHGEIPPTLPNLVRALSCPAWSGVQIRLIPGHGAISVAWGGGWHTLCDYAYSEIKLALELLDFGPISTARLHEAMTIVCTRIRHAQEGRVATDVR